MTAKCQICDRVSNTPWCVFHFPGHEKYRSLPIRIALTMNVDLRLYKIMTCGDAICKFRAVANGVPGQRYKRFDQR